MKMFTITLFFVLALTFAIRANPASKSRTMLIKVAYNASLAIETG